MTSNPPDESFASAVDHADLKGKVCDSHAKRATGPQAPTFALPFNRRIGALISAGIAALAGVSSSLLMPHGPATTPQVLLVIVGSLLTGLAAGWITRSRWAMLIAPAAHMIAIEVIWTDVEGATTGAIRLDQGYGILALILGRGLMDMFSVMYPQIQHLDFRRDLALEWYEQLEAPRKGLYSFENAAHAVAFEQFEEFHRIMLETIVPATYRK